MTGPAAPERTRGTDTGAGPDRGLWVFVLGDMTVFALFFVVLLVEYRRDRPGFAAAAEGLALPLGVVNTIVLLTGSYLVVLATGAHRGGAPVAAVRPLEGAAATAVAFVVLKAVEYVGVVGTVGTVGTLGGPGAGDAAPGAVFTALYFVVTGLHLLHVLVGATLLGVWRARAVAGAPWDRVTGAAAVYWHLVDLLWVVIFSLVYLVARTP